MSSLRTLAILMVVVALSHHRVSAEQKEIATSAIVDPRGISGALMLVGDGEISNEVRQTLFKLGGRKRGRLVIISSASEEENEVPVKPILEEWAQGWRSVDVVHFRNGVESSSWIEPLRNATAVWISGASRHPFTKDTEAEILRKELSKLLRRGGVIAGTNVITAMASQEIFQDNDGNQPATQGSGFLPHSIIDFASSKEGVEDPLRRAVQRHPQCVGVEVDESTALVLQGRTLRVLGKGNSRFCFAVTEFYKDELTISLRPGETGDWVQLQRTAHERLQPLFPPVRFPQAPECKGSLVIVGGGGMPSDVLDRFIELAGGPAAKIVVLPTAMPELADAEQEAALFANYSVSSLTVLPQTSPEEVQEASFLQSLDSATGVWFGGGRQWRYVDTYSDYSAWQAIKNVVERGGVVGGSSAGATIQGDLLVRGHPLGNEVMIADGYRHGLALLPGTAIDQHFKERNRFRDLESVIRRFPSVTGIGIDEQTALVVTGGTANVMGAGSVWLYRADQMPSEATNAQEVPVEFRTGSHISLPSWKAEP